MESITGPKKKPGRKPARVRPQKPSKAQPDDKVEGAAKPGKPKPGKVKPGKVKPTKVKPGKVKPGGKPGRRRHPVGGE